MEKNTQQQNNPSTQHQDDASTHITPRKPIVDNDYKVSPIDTEVRSFVVMSYGHAKVVQIGDHVLTAKLLRPNFIDGFIVDEVNVDVSPPIAYHRGTQGSLFGLQRMQNSTVNARDSRFILVRTLNL